AHPAETSVRPLHLLEHPEPIGVIVTPSEDRDGKPVSLTWGSKVHRILHSTGPERIAGQWWRGHHPTRDYLAAETPNVRRHGVFRIKKRGRCYVHGDFE